MTHKKYEEYDAMVCQDCIMWIANGDTTGADDRWSEEDAIEYVEAVAEDGGQVIAGDSDKDDEFSWSACDCCKTTLGGSRHHAVELYMK